MKKIVLFLLGLALITSKTITTSDLASAISQASAGDTIEIKTIHGIKEAQVPSGTQNGDRITLKGEGVPYLGSDTQKGNHYVEIKVSVPKKLTTEEEKLYKELYAISKKQEPNIFDKMKQALKK